MSTPLEPEHIAETTRWTTEKKAWWITFSTLVLLVVVMLGAWD